MTTAPPVIHVVDDDTMFRTAIARLLRASGYQVALYESGDQFLQGPLRNEPGSTTKTPTYLSRAPTSTS